MERRREKAQKKRATNPRIRRCATEPAGGSRGRRGDVVAQGSEAIGNGVVRLIGCSSPPPPWVAAATFLELFAASVAEGKLITKTNKLFLPTHESKYLFTLQH
jgi:hypothetical protein